MNVVELAETVRSATALCDLGAPLQRFVQAHGFECYSFIGIRGYRIMPDTGIPAYCATIPDAWEQAYIQHDFLPNDPGLHLVMRSSRPIGTDDLRPEDLPPAQRTVLEACIDHGMNRFLCVPTRGPGGTMSALFAHTHNTESAYREALHGGLAAMIAAAAFIHESLDDQRTVPESDVTLTERERECMLWLARGSTTWEISRIMHISERTVRFHVQNVMEKLAVHNRVHAVARAVAHGLIDP